LQAKTEVSGESDGVFGRSGCGVALLAAQDAERALGTAAAFGSDAEFLTQLAHRACTFADRIADLAIGYSTADTNVQNGTP
jgi:hypothetical protein